MNAACSRSNTFNTIQWHGRPVRQEPSTNNLDTYRSAQYIKFIIRPMTFHRARRRADPRIASPQVQIPRIRRRPRTNQRAPKAAHASAVLCKRRGTRVRGRAPSSLSARKRSSTGHAGPHVLRRPPRPSLLSSLTKGSATGDR